MITAPNRPPTNRGDPFQEPPARNGRADPKSGCRWPPPQPGEHSTVTPTTVTRHHPTKTATNCSPPRGGSKAGQACSLPSWSRSSPQNTHNRSVYAIVAAASQAASADSPAATQGAATDHVHMQWKPRSARLAPELNHVPPKPDQSSWRHLDGDQQQWPTKASCLPRVGTNSPALCVDHPYMTGAWGHTRSQASDRA